jgi:beta-glucuronidase
LRKVTWDARGIHLDGAFVRLLGVCRHEDHAEYGCALPVAAMRRDLELIQLLGANAVRTTHYPNDERFLDLCDELGLLVWEENHARGQDLAAMRHPRFREQAMAVTIEMVEQHRNHPSIIIWGILNECASHQAEGREAYVEECSAIRARDRSRPVTYASNQQGGDLCLDLCDLPAWNLYPLWYDDLPPATVIDRVVAAHEQPLAGRALIVSEIGAGGIPGLRDPVRRSKWSEERQADILSAQLAGALAHPQVAGVFIWQFCDVRITDAGGWPLVRPGGINDKGLVDRWRCPKPAFAAAQAAFRAHLSR